MRTIILYNFFINPTHNPHINSRIMKYTKELNVQYLVALLKAHNIKHVISSPGTTNLSFVASLQCDSFFIIHSCVDERSAAYMAIGIAEELQEPVVITCTGATASRNYLSAMTEAYYRKLPILSVTGTQTLDRVGQLNAQVIDRSRQPIDTYVKSVNVRQIKNSTDAHYCQLYINDAIISLKRKGGGPVHINLETIYNRDFSFKELPDVNIIQYLSYCDVDRMPILPKGRIGIFVGAHKDFTDLETNAIDAFCASNNAVVFCDHTSGYYGKYKVNFSLVAVQEQFSTDLINVDLCIHIGEISGEYGMLEALKIKELWRVSLDGEIRSALKLPRYIFDISEEDFFNYYSVGDCCANNDYFSSCKTSYDNILSSLPDIPFSNVWIASQMMKRLPTSSVLHLGILNSLRCWNLFELPKGVKSFSNVGGFGIDGCMSSMVGASIVSPEKIFFGVFGDLAFFYDINVLGNRHIGKNLRILLVNNGKGTEFRNFYHTGSLFGDDADAYIAAAGHFGNKSNSLVKAFSENLGFKYISANSKDEFNQHLDYFIDSKIGQSVVFEVFTNSEDESKALKEMWTILQNGSGKLKSKIGNLVRYADKVGILPTIQKVLGRSGVKFFKKLLR